LTQHFRLPTNKAWNASLDLHVSVEIFGNGEFGYRWREEGPALRDSCRNTIYKVGEMPEL
jgi:hypothetical protein